MFKVQPEEYNIKWTERPLVNIFLEELNLKYFEENEDQVKKIEELKNQPVPKTNSYYYRTLPEFFQWKGWEFEKETFSWTGEITFEDCIHLPRAIRECLCERAETIGDLNCSFGASFDFFSGQIKSSSDNDFSLFQKDYPSLTREMINPEGQLIYEPARLTPEQIEIGKEINLKNSLLYDYYYKIAEQASDFNPYEDFKKWFAEVAPSLDKAEVEIKDLLIRFQQTSQSSN